MRNKIMDMAANGPLWRLPAVVLAVVEAVTVTAVFVAGHFFYGQVGAGYLLAGAAAGLTAGLAAAYGLYLCIRRLRLTEETLRAGDERFRTLIELTNDWVWEMDNQTRYTYASPNVKKLLGYEPEEMIGRTPFEFMPQEEGERFARTFEEVKARMRSFRHVRNEKLHRDGRRLIFETSGRPLLDRQGTVIGFRGMGRDVTGYREMEISRRLLEKRLQHAQRMETMGTLAGGIAHELNNALSSVTGHMQLLQMDCPGDESVRRHSRTIMAACRRMSDMTRKMQAYAREGKYDLQVFSLGDFVEETIPLLRHTLSEGVELALVSEGEDLRVRADAVQLQMVLMSVVANAVEAMEGPGRIVVDLAKVELSGLEESLGLPAGRYVKLSVEDAGRGMDAATLERLFDPFFTTKFQGRGLSMSAVYGIVQKHGGVVKAESLLGQGTQIRIYLPAADYVFPAGTRE